MELQEAIAAYRERITHVLSQTDPPPTDEWLKDKTDELMAPFDGLVSEQPLSP
jgi:hypothetical protein